MIARATENWLTSTNERNYQAAFCQTLMHKGHKLIYISRYGPNVKLLAFWGESAFPYFFAVVKYLELMGRADTAASLLRSILIILTKHNVPHRPVGMANPYYSVHDIMEAVLGIDPDKVDFADFPGSSHILEHLILMIARRGGRPLLKRSGAMYHTCGSESSCSTNSKISLPGGWRKECTIRRSLSQPRVGASLSQLLRTPVLFWLCTELMWICSASLS